jgi:hypothetical protein
MKERSAAARILVRLSMGTTLSADQKTKKVICSNRNIAHPMKKHKEKVTLFIDHIIREVSMERRKTPLMAKKTADPGGPL